MEKVLIVVPRLIGHGMERMAVLAAEVLSDGYDTEIVVFTEKDKQYETSSPIINLNVPAADSKISKIINVFRRVGKMRQYRSQVAPYAVISFGTSANIVNALSKGTGKTVISYRGYATVKKGVSFNLSCKLADWIFCISEGMLDHLQELCPWAKQKSSVIYNSIDLDSIKMKLKEPVAYSPKHPSFVAVGRHEPVKGYLHLLNAFALVKQSIPESSLTLIGEGSETIHLKKRASDLGMADSVNFLGSKENPFPYIKKCDICVGTSITEGFMNVLIEAGACEVPTISVDCNAGPREILSERKIDSPLQEIEYADYGILVPSFRSWDSDEPEKEKLLAEAMVKLATDEAMRMRYKSKLYERTKDFSVNKYKADLIELLESRLINVR